MAPPGKKACRYQEEAAVSREKTTLASISTVL
jgi:hypothetical protein